MVLRDAGPARQPRPLAAVVEQVSQRERKILRLDQRAGESREQFGLGDRGGDRCGRVAQQADAAFTEDAFGFLGDDTQMSGDGAAVVGDRTVGEGVVRLLRVSAAFEEEEELVVPGRLARLQNALDAGTNLRPDLGPHLA